MLIYCLAGLVQAAHICAEGKPHAGHGRHDMDSMSRTYSLGCAAGLTFRRFRMEPGSGKPHKTQKPFAKTGFVSPAPPHAISNRGDGKNSEFRLCGEQGTEYTTAGYFSGRG